MPEVSRFFGIIIGMFVEAGGQHYMPHLDAYYQEDVGIYDITKIERLAGSLPRRQERLVLAWAELHQQELLSNWLTAGYVADSIGSSFAETHCSARRLSAGPDSGQL